MRKRAVGKKVPSKDSPKHGHDAGYTLIELLAYLAIFTTISILATASLFSSLEDYSTLRATENALSSGQTAMKRMVYEIRRAESVATTTSDFSGNIDTLVLNSRHPTTGVAYQIGFLVNASSTLEIEEDGALLGLVTRENTDITALNFTRLVTPYAVALKVDFTILGESRRSSVSEDFQNTIILRNK